MKTLNFLKMDAFGNDYVYVVTEQNPGLDVNELIAHIPKISDRHSGIGSDGLIIVGRENGNIWCRMFNADASESEMCGNGLRCVARLCYDLGWSNRENTFSITMKKTGHVVNARINSNDVSIEMGKAKVGGKETLEYNGKKIDYIRVSMTNPHAVVECNDLDTLEINKIGPYVETHKNFPNRTNVEFIKIIDASNIRFRVWERGSGETMACGSGACAVFAAVHEQKRCKDKVNMQMRGGTAQVEISASGAIYLTGPVTYVFKGEYSL
jgi:diaminopimelate epimerase